MASPSWVKSLTEENQIITEGKSHVRTVTLNRPTKSNAFTYRLVSQLINELQTSEKNPKLKMLIVKGRGRSFCSGVDASSLFTFISRGNWTFGAHFYRKLQTLNFIMSKYKMPSVFLINGSVMGAGACFASNGGFRVVTEDTVFAMPEAQIGLFIDVGSSYFLSRLPGFLGEYIGLTGAKLDAAEMLACGFATHFVSSKNMGELEESLNKIDTHDPHVIDMIINQYSEKLPLAQACSVLRENAINKCFSKETVEGILAALEQESVTEQQEWISEAIDSMKRASPTSLKLLFRSIREGRDQTYKECLEREYIMFSHVLRRTISGDAFEGVATQFIDKTGTPKWDPPTLQQVTDKMINKCFVEVDAGEDWLPLNLPTRDRDTYMTPILARL